VDLADEIDFFKTSHLVTGTVDIDFETEPLGKSSDGTPIFLRDIYPTRSEIHAVEQKYVIPAMFQHVYSRIQKGSEPWTKLEAPSRHLYPWDDQSTYIKRPPFFDDMTKEVPPVQSVHDAAVLLYLGDSVTTDHISPAGSIARNSPAARYLASRGLVPREFNSYGARRGNDEIMARGTFANIRLINKLVSKPGPRTLYIPTGEEMDIFDAAEMYAKEGRNMIVISGKEYGSGSSRDWAAKGPWKLGIKGYFRFLYYCFTLSIWSSWFEYFIFFEFDKLFPLWNHSILLSVIHSLLIKGLTDSFFFSYTSVPGFIYQSDGLVLSY